MLSHDPARKLAMDVSNTVLISISSGLSMLGSILIILTYILYKDIQTVSRHLIVCISIADFFTVLANITGVFMYPAQEGEDTQCILQSFVGTTAVLCSFLWTISLAIFLYVTLVKENKKLAEHLVWPWFHLICWLLPLAINVMALCLKKLGNSRDDTSSGWCWIRIKGMFTLLKITYLWRNVLWASSSLLCLKCIYFNYIVCSFI